MRELSIPRGIVVGITFIVLCAVCIAVPAANDETNVATRLAKLERSLESRGLVDLLQQVEALQQEMQRLRGQIEEQAYTIEQLRKTQRDSYVDIDQRMRTIENQGGLIVQTPPDAAGAPPLTTLDTGGADTVAGTPAAQSSLQVETGSGTVIGGDPAIDAAGQADPGATSSAVAPTVVAVAPASIAPRGPTIDNEDSEAAYRDAFSLLKAGQYDESIAAFNDFLQLYPSSQYADNAQYWLGETYYVEREFEAAVAEYRKLIEAYPQSKKQSHAMLKIGYSYHELGKLDQARAVLEDLRNQYAGSTAARLAEERIQRILAENPNQ